jgi:hypothetical protein
MKINVDTVNYDPSLAFRMADEKARSDAEFDDKYMLVIKLIAVSYGSCADKSRSGFTWEFEVTA